MTITQGEAEKVLGWMESQDIGLPELARELGMSYDGVYQALKLRGRVSDGIKLRFIERFGMDTAKSIFNGNTPAQPKPEPESDSTPVL